MRALQVMATAIAACLAGGCSAESSRPDAATSYEGFLYLPEGQGRHPQAGAAGDVVECDNFGAGSAFRGVYNDGATADSPDQALDYAFNEGLSLSLPKDLAVSAIEDDRVLYVAEVKQEPKVAVVVHDGAGSEGAGGDGWHLESWAACDIVELPPEFIRHQGYQVWTTTDGKPVSTDELEVFRGSEHCDHQDMTYLNLGRYDDGVPLFVRQPHADLQKFFDDEFLPHTTLPADAQDTGYRRGDDRLWVAPDKSRAYVGATPTDVELWPRARDRLGCA